VRSALHPLRVGHRDRRQGVLQIRGEQGSQDDRREQTQGVRPVHRDHRQDHPGRYVSGASDDERRGHQGLQPVRHLDHRRSLGLPFRDADVQRWDDAAVHQEVVEEPGT
jgi:hypothetical protein